MKTYLSLTGLFLRDLVRRRVPWFLLIVGASTIAFNYLLNHEIGRLMEQGATYDSAVRVLATGFDQRVATWLPYIMMIATAMAILIAPESRRNGTTQFVLSVPMRRRSLALTQFSAGVVFVVAAILLAHAGIAIGGWRIGALAVDEMLLSWAALLLPAIAVSLVVFMLSTVFSVATTCLLFFGVPFLLPVVTELVRQLRAFDPTFVLKMLEHSVYLFPRLDTLIFWPRLPTEALAAVSPAPAWPWLCAHAAVSILFWVVLSSWLYMRHDFGSRTALK